MKKIFAFLCLFSILFSVVSCNNYKNKSDSDNNEKLVTAPSEEYIIECLQKVPGILEIVAVTEETDPMNSLNKPGWYTSNVYFSYQLVNQEEVYGTNLLDKGTDAGGSIEVYKTKDEANERNDYLSAFDGSVLSPGSHTVIGTIVVRISDELTASQQKLLESNIIAALTDDLESLIDPFNNSNISNLDYEYLIDFPARTADNTCNHNVRYLVYYPAANANAVYADVEITKFTYSFDDLSNEKLTINFNFECYIMDMYEYSKHFAFNIVAYDSNNIRIATALYFGEGTIGETIETQISLTLDKEDVKNGVTIDFCNYYE